MDVENISNFTELMKKINNPDIKSAYHYTNLDSLIKILKNKCLKMSSLRKMNDLFEQRLFPNCNDFFFCLSKNSLSKENFGLWAMYGKLTLPRSDDAKNIGVKIYFSKKVLQQICEINSLQLHSVAYTSLRESYRNGEQKKITIGSQTVKQEIVLDYSQISGCLKDNSWLYENELRLRKHNDDIMKDESFISITDDIISQLIIYPSPYYEAKDCIKLLEKAGLNNINVQENMYRKTILDVR